MLLFAGVIFSTAFLLFLLLRLLKRHFHDENNFERLNGEDFNREDGYKLNDVTDSLRRRSFIENDSRYQNHCQRNGSLDDLYEDTAEEDKGARARKLSELSFARKFYGSEILIKVVDVSLWSLLWYGFSVSLVVYNKWLLNSWEGGFKFPVTMSTAHMGLKLALSFMVSFTRRFFP